SEALVRKGIEVFVVTQGSAELPADEIINGVRVLRTIPVAVTANNFVEDILQLNFQLLERALVLFRELDNNLDIIHGHDWLVFWAIKVFIMSLITQLILTIHANELCNIHARNH